MISPRTNYEYNENEIIDNKKKINVRGRGGRGGSRSIMTDRGGTGKAPKRRMTV